jgi:hypothetical protein
MCPKLLHYNKGSAQSVHADGDSLALERASEGLTGELRALVAASLLGQFFFEHCQFRYSATYVECTGNKVYETT